MGRSVVVVQWMRGAAMLVIFVALFLTRHLHAQAQVEKSLPQMLVSPWWFDFMSVTGIVALAGLAAAWGSTRATLQRHGEDIQKLLHAREESVKPHELVALEDRMDKEFNRIHRTLERLFPMLGREERHGIRGTPDDN